MNILSFLSLFLYFSKQYSFSPSTFPIQKDRSILDYYKNILLCGRHKKLQEIRIFSYMQYAVMLNVRAKVQYCNGGEPVNNRATLLRRLVATVSMNLGNIFVPCR
ncbi:unnamed protein product [Ixodes persulcatus]